MTYFRGMEGARAWLSWAVVFSHIVHLTGADHAFPVLKPFLILGDFAVNIFIMISGFVITSLILEKRETYKVYITRRFLRIYPVFLLCLTIGIFTSGVYAETMLSQPWGELSPPTDRLVSTLQSLKDNGYLPHILAHLSLLHGAIPNNILYDSQYMFLSPAWSLSLEWQFYLVAPFLIALIQKPKGSIIASVGMLFLLVAYQLGMFGFFRLHSILAGAGVFFAVGIGARFLLPKLPRLETYPVAFILIAFGCSIYGFRTLAFFIFMVLMIYTMVNKPSDQPGKAIEKILNALLDSKIARYMGKISYSTYLIHAPIIELCIYIFSSHLHLTLVQTLGALCLVVPPITFILSALINKFLEQPFINLGKSLFASNKQLP